MAVEGERAMDRKQIVAKKQQFVYPAVANYFADPLPLERGEMQHVWDVEGKRYLDFFGGIVTVGVGHCNPRITGPQKAQIDKLGHTSTLYPHETMVGVGYMVV
jgi:4-aminobutyrate aminotransferase-like enzyme